MFQVISYIGNYVHFLVWLLPLPCNRLWHHVRHRIPSCCCDKGNFFCSRLIWICDQIPQNIKTFFFRSAMDVSRAPLQLPLPLQILNIRSLIQISFGEYFHTKQQLCLMRMQMQHTGWAHWMGCNQTNWFTLYFSHFAIFLWFILYVCCWRAQCFFSTRHTSSTTTTPYNKKKGQIILFIFICEWILWGFRKGSHPNSSSLFIFSWQPHKHDELWPRLSLSTDTINWFSCAGTQRLGACRLTSTHRVIKEMWLNSFGNNIYVHVVPFESNMTLLYMLL